MITIANLDPIEADECLKQMVYVIDRREQPTAALEKRLTYLQPYERETVCAGDYTAKTLLPSGEWYYLPVALERKMSLTEIAGNLTRERTRFTAEFERAREHGLKLYVIVEQATWENAYAGIYRSKMKPKSLIASLLTWGARYDTPILFCERSDTSGKLIRDILYYEMREHLERMIDYG